MAAEGYGFEGRPEEEKPYSCGRRLREEEFRLPFFPASSEDWSIRITLMRIVEKDIWQAHAEGCTVVVPTNGAVNRRGCAIMGRGVAWQAANRFPNLAWKLGADLKLRGNHVYHFPDWRVITFPVKHSWMEMADPDLIRRSATELKELLERTPEISPVVMPKVGCGNGRLSWESVEPILDACGLGDKAIIVSLKGRERRV